MQKVFARFEQFLFKIKEYCSISKFSIRSWAKKVSALLRRKQIMKVFIGGMIAKSLDNYRLEIRDNPETIAKCESLCSMFISVGESLHNIGSQSNLFRLFLRRNYHWLSLSGETSVDSKRNLIGSSMVLSKNPFRRKKKIDLNCLISWDG